MKLDPKFTLVMFWSMALLIFAWFGKLENPELIIDFIKWMVGLYIAGNVGDKWANNNGGK